MGESSEEPRYVHRVAQSYVAIPAHVPREELATMAPRLLGQLNSWLDAHRVDARGKPIIRYIVVNYNDTTVDIEVGVPVDARPLPVDGSIKQGVLPEGTYAMVVHRGAYESLVDTTAALLDWGKARGVRWQVREKDGVTEWAGRVEHYVVGPGDEPDPVRWRTEVAILVVPTAAGGRTT